MWIMGRVILRRSECREFIGSVIDLFVGYSFLNVYFFVHLFSDIGPWRLYVENVSKILLHDPACLCSEWTADI